MPVGHSGEGALTPEAIADVKRRMGEIHPAKAWWSKPTAEILRHFAEGYGDRSRLFRDEAYARETVFGRLVAAPTFLYSALAAGGGTGGVGLPGAFGLHANENWEWFERVLEGDQITGTRRLVQVEEKESRWGQKVVHQSLQTEFFTNGDRLVARATEMSVRSDRRKARDANVEESRAEVYRYTDEALDEIAAAYDNEEVRNGKPRYVEDVKVGDSLGRVVRGPLSVRDMVTWYMGRGAPYMKSYGYWHDFMKRRPGIGIINPETNIRESPEAAHFDAELARRSGMAAPYDIGMLRVAVCTSVVTNWCGDLGFLRHMKTWFNKPHYVGETAWLTGTVTSVDLASGDVGYELEMTNQLGLRLTRCEGIVRLPTRSIQKSMSTAISG
jgi:acyl dehydratase